MRVETLKSPGVITSGLRLRTEAAKAISAAELFLQPAGKQVLTDFFVDCATKAGGASVPAVTTATQVIVDDADVIVVTAADAATANATLDVAGGVLVSTTLPDTVALVADEQEIEGVVVTGTGTTATITVVDGVITAIALSAAA